MRDTYQQDFPEDEHDLIKLLQNMNLAADNGMLNLAGVLLFAERPEWIKPQFIVKSICYPGNDIHSTKYLDTEDFSGPMRKIFDDALAFIMRNLKKVQDSQGINTPGNPEIPRIVFEELLVNALVHRDYLVSAPIRVFIFDNRIEIISPGSLPNNLTVEKIRTGNSNIRNPILASFVAKKLLPYRGLGSGIRRALEAWFDIDFFDDREGCTFTAIIHRVKGHKTLSGAPLNANKGAIVSIKGQSSGINAPLSDLQSQIVGLIRETPTISYDELTLITGKDRSTVRRNVGKLKDMGLLHRIGSKKTGYWEVKK